MSSTFPLSEYDAVLVRRPDGRWQVEVETLAATGLVDTQALGAKIRDALAEANRRNTEAK